MSYQARRALRTPQTCFVAGMCMLCAAVATGCSGNPERPARSSAGCAQAVVDHRLPGHLEDKLAHCTAGALIAYYCSPTEARMAGVAKELRDAFTGGDVEGADLQATWAGVACARAAPDVAAIEACCTSACAACSRTLDRHGPAR